MKRTTDHRPPTPGGVIAIGIALGLLVWLLSAGWGRAQGGATVTGTVTNQTPGGTVPAGLTVNLYAFDQALEQTGLYTATLGADGTFSFTGLTPQADETYFVRVIYLDTAYVSEAGTFAEGQTALTLPVQIAELTEDTSQVEVAQLHLFIAAVDNMLQLAEYYLVSNTGDRTVIGTANADGQREVLTISLPSEATDLTFVGSGLGERFLERDAGFVDTQPVAPGIATSQVRFSYLLPYQSGMQLVRGLEVPVQSVVILLVDQGLTLSGEGLVKGESMETQMGPAQSYTAGPLAAGESLALTISGTPKPPDTSSALSGESASGAETTTPLTRNPMREAGVGVLALAAALVAAYTLWARVGPGALPARARPFVEAIAALDADFEAGKIGEAAYRQKREALKRQVQAVVK